MKNLIVGIVIGISLSAAVVGAYTWDFDKSLPDNFNAEQQERIQRERNMIEMVPPQEQEQTRPPC